uniref:Uncharacterized protein n=1 Tax=Plectus sambesii TaxID=2011161 RepID=A0A914V111_9BILA
MLQTCKKLSPNILKSCPPSDCYPYQALQKKSPSSSYSLVIQNSSTLATYPCPFCLVERAALGSAAEWEYCQLHTTRTIEDYNCAAGQHKDAIPSHKQSQTTNSISQPPLFPILIKDISPPQLHIALGIGTALYKALERACWEVDMPAVGLAPSSDAKIRLAEAFKELKV